LLNRQFASESPDNSVALAYPVRRSGALDPAAWRGAARGGAHGCDL